MELQSTAGLERLRAIQDEWRGLLSRGAQNEPTLSPEWVLPWCEVFGGVGGREVKVAELREAGRLVGLAPLVARRRRHRRILELRRLELACSGEPTEDEVLSEYVGVLAERGLEDAVAGAFVSAVVAGRFGPVDEFSIPSMSSEDPMPEALVAAFRSAGWRASLVRTAEAPYATLPGTWEEYLAALPSRRRHTVRRAERDLEAWAGGPPTLRVAEDPKSLEEGRRTLERLHGERWQAAGRSGVFASSAFNDFHARVMPVFLERGALELLWIEARGEPLAVLYNLVWSGRIYNYQSGRRMDLPASVRPGLASHALAIRRAITLGRREYDFLGGAGRYKREFSTATRGLLWLEAARPGPRDVARRLLDLVASAAALRRSRSGMAAEPATSANSAAS